MLYFLVNSTPGDLQNRTNYSKYVLTKVHPTSNPLGNYKDVLTNQSYSLFVMGDENESTVHNFKLGTIPNLHFEIRI